MSTTSQERETEQVTGTLSGIIQKGPDKWQAAVVPDNSQYAKNLWTKDAALVGTLSGLIGQRIAFLCNVSHWTMNDGTPVRSLWIEQVGQGAAQAPQQQPWEQAQQAQAQAQPAAILTGAQMTAQLPTVPVTPTVTQQPYGFQPSGNDVKEQRIHRQTASKVAAIMLTHVQPEERTMSTLLVLAERLVAYYNEGLPVPEPTLDALMTQAQPRSMDEAMQALPTDDDIPFLHIDRFDIDGLRSEHHSH